MGALNFKSRIVGDWTLEEEINLIKSIEKATQIQILFPLIKIKFRVKDN